MADDKSGREAQARSAERRQREREIAAELERGGEAEPPIDATELVDFEVALESLTYPTTGAEIVTTLGEHEIDAADRTYTVEELLPEADVETFDSPADVRVRVQRPTIAATMKRIVDVHHPGIKEQLLTTALTQFYEIRDQAGLKKKPSTSEVLDWLKLLLAEDLDPADLARDGASALPKLHGALLKNEQDVQLFERLAFMARSGR